MMCLWRAIGGERIGGVAVRLRNLAPRRGGIILRLAAAQLR